MNNQICGLNYLDVVIRKGAIPLGRLGSTFPFTMGVEAAGIVEKIGDKVDGVAVGERVAYVVIGSGEYFMFTHSFVHLMEIVQIGYLTWPFMILFCFVLYKREVLF